MALNADINSTLNQTMVPLRPWYYVGTLSVIVAASSSANLLVIMVFCKIRRRLLRRDRILMSLAACNLLEALFGYVPQIYWISSASALDDPACSLSGFLVVFLSCSSIGHLLWIACEIPMAISKPFLFEKLSRRQYFLHTILALAWFYGLICALPPLFNVSRYVPEAGLTSCSLDWSSEALSSRIYILSLFVFAYAMPITILVIALVVTRKALQQMHMRCKEQSGFRNPSTAKDIIKAQLKFKVVILLMASAFFATWTPYAVLTFWATLAQRPPLLVLSSLSTLCAKSSTLFNPIIYTFKYKRFRVALGLTCRLCVQKEVTHTRKTQPTSTRISLQRFPEKTPDKHSETALFKSSLL